MIFRLLSGLLLWVSLAASAQTAPTPRQPADLVVYNATVYTVDSAFSKAQAFAVRGGKFVAVGSSAAIRKRFRGKREVDAKGQFIYPGFYDAHCHFYGYALTLAQADLVGAASWAATVARLTAHRRAHPGAAWLVGRGWDQNDWPDQRFPSKDTLDRLFPATPVFLERVDGHAALVNQKALDLAGITAQTPISGGVIGRDAQGRLTGLLVDNAVGLVESKLPAPTPLEAENALLQAQRNCLAVGLTSLAEAGLDRPQIELVAQLQAQRKLHLRLYVMITPTPANLDYYLAKGPTFSDQLTISAFKVYADGALGSRGACLLRPYADRPAETGFLLRTVAEYRTLARRLAASRFQMNTHAIGDSANRLILNVYGEALAGQKDRRWRIEHAQIVSPADVPKFGQFGIVPSVQPTHATSDMPWAGERLGPARLKTAYAFKALQQQYGQVALGTDFPVENINPFYTFHAAVARQDARSYPPGGFQPENALTRADALRGMTTWAAHAGFEEKRKGQIHQGMLADFIVLKTDLLTAPSEQLRELQVQQTWISGELTFNK